MEGDNDTKEKVGMMGRKTPFLVGGNFSWLPNGYIAIGVGFIT